jgi:hypothetical protein
MLLLSAVSSAFGGTIVRECYGSKFSTDVESVGRMDEMQDWTALQKLYDHGWVTLLKVGDKVDVEEVEWNQNLRIVRRPGDIAEWYIPMQCVSLH